MMFTVQKSLEGGHARAGSLHTGHGDVLTPVFMPVGTQGAVKAMEHRTLRELDAQIILGNTYHLYLRPGADVLEHMGGLHRFAGWDRAILTDSGGFQVWSLRELRKMTNEGVTFRSHLDGSRHLFTAESVVNMQRSIGSDILMVLDECTSWPATPKDARESMELTVRWAERSRAAMLATKPLYGHPQFQFAIGQGSTYADLRVECMQKLVEMDFDGYAMGGLSVGEPAEDMYAMVEASTAVMPVHKPRYLMGVGTPENILRSIALGVDMFDCVMPTRNARNGTIFTTSGRLNIKNARNRLLDEPLDAGLDNPISQNTSLAYLRHLFHAGEILGLMLATTQNVALYLWLARTARERILDGSFTEWSRETIEKLNRQRT
jgi:queuine tRNA-ribosyltransferase